MKEKKEIKKEDHENRERNGFTITKKVAKHGSQSIIVIPRILEAKLRPGTLIELKIDVLEEVK